MGNPNRDIFPDMPVGKQAITDSEGVEYNAGNPLPTTEEQTISGTATLSNVNDSASNIQLSAANPNREGWFVYNDSTVALYVSFGVSASTTSFTVKIAAQGFYEMPMPIYTGIINGIWDSNASGAARITELT